MEKQNTYYIYFGKDQEAYQHGRYEADDINEAIELMADDWEITENHVEVYGFEVINDTHEVNSIRGQFSANRTWN